VSLCLLRLTGGGPTVRRQRTPAAMSASPPALLSLALLSPPTKTPSKTPCTSRESGTSDAANMGLKFVTRASLVGRPVHGRDRWPGVYSDANPTSAPPSAGPDAADLTDRGLPGTRVCRPAADRPAADRPVADRPAADQAGSSVVPVNQIEAGRLRRS
jgi:hypothetical protein